MERVHDILSDVASLVDSPAFREEQEAFYRKYCAEFSAGDDSTENKLSYTSIHNTYVEMVERMSKRLHFILFILARQRPLWHTLVCVRSTQSPRTWGSRRSRR